MDKGPVYICNVMDARRADVFVQSHACRALAILGDIGTRATLLWAGQSVFCIMAVYSCFLCTALLISLRMDWMDTRQTGAIRRW